MKNMENIKILRNSLITDGWCITAFPFQYKKVNYTVLFEVLDQNIPANQYYLALLTFINEEKNIRLEVKANSSSFKIDPRQFREFFNISYTENLGNIFQQFYSYFNQFIPREFQQPNEIQKKYIISQLNKNDNDNAEYCYKVYRNGQTTAGIQKYRSIFNDNKTRILRSNLYENFKNDQTISFCYSDNPLNEKTDNEIIVNFAKNLNR